jgi:hypothetical protein
MRRMSPAWSSCDAPKIAVDVLIPTPRCDHTPTSAPDAIPVMRPAVASPLYTPTTAVP